MNINEAAVDCVSDEVCTDVDVFHVGVRLGVVCIRKTSFHLTPLRCP